MWPPGLQRWTAEPSGLCTCTCFLRKTCPLPCSASPLLCLGPTVSLMTGLRRGGLMSFLRARPSSPQGWSPTGQHTYTHAYTHAMHTHVHTHTRATAVRSGLTRNETCSPVTLDFRPRAGRATHLSSQAFHHSRQSRGGVARNRRVGEKADGQVGGRRPPHTRREHST